MAPLAWALASAGWAVWNPEYERVGRLVAHGGWPRTFITAAAGARAIERFGEVDQDRVVVLGHSAGGQLAFWIGAGAPWPESSTPLLRQRPAGVIGLAPILDLARAHAQGLGKGSVEALLGGSPLERPERYRSTSPTELLPLGVPQRIVHGLDDTVVPPSESQRYVELASHHDDVRLDLLPGVGHRGVIVPRRRLVSVVRCALEELTC